MIPKLIHQTAKTSDIPEKWRGYQSTLKSLHPDWTYRLWTDDDNQVFVKKEYPEFFDAFNRLPRNIMRADVIRYLLMYRLGGLYMDLDYEMLKPFDLIGYDIVLPWESSGEFGEGKDKISNAIFASAPGHPFWKMAIDDLAAHPPIGENLDVENSTGPVFLSRIFRRALDSGMQIFSPPRPWFNPITPHSPQAYRAIVAENVSYGIHHCHGSWRDRSFTERLRGKAGQLYHRVFDRA